MAESDSQAPDSCNLELSSMYIEFSNSFSLNYQIHESDLFSVEISLKIKGVMKESSNKKLLEALLLDLVVRVLSCFFG